MYDLTIKKNFWYDIQLKPKELSNQHYKKVTTPLNYWTKIIPNKVDTFYLFKKKKTVYVHLKFLYLIQP